MKSVHYLSGLLAACLVIGMPGCTDETTLPDLDGSLVGFVYTFDEFAKPFIDHSGVLITAYGRANILQTHTSDQGRFEFRNLPAGTYELHLEKEGFGTMKLFSVQHLGGEPTTLGLNFSPSVNSSAVFLYQLPTTLIGSLSFRNDTLSGIFVFTGAEPEVLYLIVYLSDEQGFNHADTKEVVKLGMMKVNGVYQGVLYSNNLHFSPGETVFYRAAVIAWGGTPITSFNRIIVGTDNYFDYEQHFTVYPNTGNESVEYSFVFPE